MIIILGLCLFLGVVIYSVINDKSSNLNNTKNDKLVYEYAVKPFMTDYERYFYNIFKELGDEYIIVPQLNLAAIISKKNSTYENELFRNVDFAIFTKDFTKLLLLIEINDQTHNTARRKRRDLRVQSICNNANIKLINFYSNYENEKNYVLNRVKNILYEINQSNI